MNEKKDNLPFKIDGMKKIESRSSDIHNVKDKKIIRSAGVGYGAESEKATDRAKKHRNILNELSEKYDFNIPLSDFIVGQGPGRSTRYYLAEDIIDGHTLDDLDFSDQPPKDEINKVLMSSIGYFKDKLLAQEDFMGDIYRPEQYMYGSIDGGDKKIYLVDLELSYAHKNKDRPSPASYACSLGTLLSELASFIRTYERLYKEKLQEPRDELKKIFEYLKENEYSFINDRDKKLDDFFGR